MSTIADSVKKRRQAATERSETPERAETPKKVKLEQGKLTLATYESSCQRKTRSKHNTPKVLCIFLAYDSKDIDRLRSAEDKYGYEAHTLSTKTMEPPSFRHLDDGNITSGFNLCIEVVRKIEWHDINFDVIAFDWHNMLFSYFPNSVRNDVFDFILGTPGFLKSGGVVDIPCTPQYYERHLVIKGSLDDLFDITFLHEHQLAEKCFLSEANEGSQHTKYCKLTRTDLKAVESPSCSMDKILEAYDKMIKDHGGDEDICMIRLIVKQNLEALPRTERSRPHEEVRDEKKKYLMKVADGDDSVTCWEGRRKTRNERRLPFAAQVRPATVVDKKLRPEELDPTIDPSSTTSGTQKTTSSSVAAAATTATTAPTGILLTNENDSESGGGGIFETAAPGRTMEAVSGN